MYISDLIYEELGTGQSDFVKKLVLILNGLP